MPKPKAFLHNKNKGRKEAPTLETADDYQAAGVDFEEAAGKHRAGDASKSLRFFERAITTYDEGLRKFPKSFDLAYNKARIQYDVATHPKLAKQLPQPVMDLLKVALASHEYALKLDENDADLLFNTSQVLTSIAEELANVGSTEEAVGLLQSALQLQARCLSVQEQKHTETLEQEIQALAPNDDEDTIETMQEDERSEVDEHKSNEEGRWALILEPVTADTLLDTILACFATMTTLCTTISTSREVPWQGPMTSLESQYQELLSKVKGLSITDPERLHELSLADAILQSAMIDVSFTFNNILPAATYKSMINKVWAASKSHLDMDTHTDALIAHANALIAVNFSLSNKDSQEVDSNSNLRWTGLTSAFKSLTVASNIASISPDAKAKTHFLRGDVSLLQYHMSTRQPAASAEMLLKNAQVFYRNAAQLGSEQEDKERALFRCTVVQHMGVEDVKGAGAPALNAVFKFDQERRASEELREMFDEGLVLDDTNSKSWMESK